MESVQTSSSSAQPLPLAASGGDDEGFMSMLGSFGAGADPAGTDADASASTAASTENQASSAMASQQSSSASVSSGSGTSSASGGDSVTAAIDNSQYSSPAALRKWAPLVQGLPADQQVAAEQALNRPIAAAEMAAAGGPGAAAAMAYINQNPALKTAIDTAAHGGKADGKISKHDLQAFAKTMQKQLGRADNTVASYEKKNPNADGQSLQVVREAALLQANLPITNAADPKQQLDGGDQKSDGDTTRAGLQAIVNSNPGLSSALQGAANTFSQPGMFALLDQGGKSGTSLATSKADGKFNEGNIIGWVKSQAPTTGGGFASMVSSAAARGAVAGVDTSSLNADVFANPQNYTGAQKAAVLVQLQTTQQQVEAGSSLRNVSTTDSQLEQKIQQLQADPDVQSFLQTAVPQSEAAIVNSDPSLANAVQQRETNEVQTGDGLRQDIDQIDQQNAKEKKGAVQESDADAINDFSSELSLESDLNGGNAPSLSQVVAGNSGLTSQLQSAYQSEFSNGGDLNNLLSQKKSNASDELQTVQTNESTFESALDPNFVQSQQASYNANNCAILQQHLLSTGKGSDVLSGLGASSSVSTDEIAGAVAETDPLQLYGAGQPALNSQDTQSLVSAFLGDLKHGSSVSDALAKFDPTSKSFDPNAGSPELMRELQSNPNLAASAGAMLRNLATSGLLMQSQSTSTGGTSGGSSSNQFETAAMLGLGAGSISANLSSYSEKKKAGGVTDLSGKLSMSGDVTGAAAGILGAILTFPDVKSMLQNGEKGEAGLSVAGATRGLIGAASDTYDIGSYLAKGASGAYRSGAAGRLAGEAVGRVVGSVAGEAAGEGVAEAIGAAAGPVGVIADVAIGIGLGIMAIVNAVKKHHERKEFDKAVDPTLDQYGITKPS